MRIGICEVTADLWAAEVKSESENVESLSESWKLSFPPSNVPMPRVLDHATEEPAMTVLDSSSSLPHADHRDVWGSECPFLDSLDEAFENMPATDVVEPPSVPEPMSGAAQEPAVHAEAEAASVSTHVGPCEKTTMKSSRDDDVEIWGLSGRKRVVTNMADKFKFFQHAVEEILDLDGDHREGTIGCPELASRLENFSLSTAYSGIGAPETTLNILHHYVQNIGSASIKPPRMLFQVEYDENCRTELMRYAELDGASKSQQTCCCFGDLNQFYRPELREVIQQLQKKPELALEILSMMVSSGEAVTTRGWCYAHEKYCDLQLGLKLSRVISYQGKSWSGKQNITE